MINNENDFLGALIKCANESNDCDWSDIFKESRLEDIDCIHFAKSLESKGIVWLKDTCTVHLNPIAFSTYESKSDKIINKIKFLSFKALGFLITYVLGIASGLFIAYLVHKFGWN